MALNVSRSDGVEPMPLVLPNQGLPDLLDWMIRHTGGDPPDLVMTLWTNDIVPGQLTTFSSLVRASFTGFFEVVLTRSGWTAPVQLGPRAFSTWGTTPTEWTLTANPVTVYGWAAYNPGPLRLVIVERFDAPRPLSIGDTFGVLPTFNLTTLFECP